MEVEKVLRLCIYGPGIVNIKGYWSTDQPVATLIFPQTMNTNHFEAIW
jgi:hypothetical protein